MTLLALAAELAEVNVILLVACRAIAGQLDLRCGFEMTLHTLQLLVCAGQRESRPGVIEFPKLPAIGRVAIVTLSAEIASMNIAIGMAGLASGIGPREGVILVARRARCDHVHADEGKSREVVVESDRGAPAIIAMALLALQAGRAPVRIVELVA